MSVIDANGHTIMEKEEEISCTPMSRNGALLCDSKDFGGYMISYYDRYMSFKVVAGGGCEEVPRSKRDE